MGRSGELSGAEWGWVGLGRGWACIGAGGPVRAERGPVRAEWGWGGVGHALAFNSIAL